MTPNPKGINSSMECNNYITHCNDIHIEQSETTTTDATTTETVKSREVSGSCNVDNNNNHSSLKPTKLDLSSQSNNKPHNKNNSMNSRSDNIDTIALKYDLQRESKREKRHQIINKLKLDRHFSDNNMTDDNFKDSQENCQDNSHENSQDCVTSLSQESMLIDTIGTYIWKFFDIMNGVNTQQSEDSSYEY
jgi:hypothetical protein